MTFLFFALLTFFVILFRSDQFKSCEVDHLRRGGSSYNTKNKLTSSDKSSPSINSSNSKISSLTPNPKSNALTKLIEEGKSEFVRVDGILRLKSDLKKKKIVVMKI